MTAKHNSTALERFFVTAIQPDDSYIPTTLPMEAGKFLREIEGLLGPRDSSYCLLGIDFHESYDSMLKTDPVPMTWYPNTGRPLNGAGSSKHIVVHLGVNSIGNLELATWQLAHECVHLIDPWNPTVEARYTNVLEEGLATWYQCRSVTDKYLDKQNYIDARDLVLKYEHPLLDAVKDIRQKEQNASGHSVRIGDISPELLVQHCKGIDPRDANALCKTFVQ